MMDEKSVGDLIFFNRRNKSPICVLPKQSLWLKANISTPYNSLLYLLTFR